MTDIEMLLAIWAWAYIVGMAAIAGLVVWLCWCFWRAGKAP